MSTSTLSHRTPTLPRSVTTALTVYVLGVALDFTTTYTLLTHPGFIETNPLASLFITTFGIFGLLILKVSLAALAYTTFRVLNANPSGSLLLSTASIGSTSLLAGLYNTTFLL